MAMGFMTASRAQNPDLITAYAKQAELQGMEQERKMNRNKMLMNGGLQVAEAWPKSTAGTAMTSGGNVVTPTLIDASTGAMASAAPEVAGGMSFGGSGATGLSSGVGAGVTTLAEAEAAAATASALGTGTAATGTGAALGDTGGS